MTVLEAAGVDFIYNTSVTDMDFKDGDGITVKGLYTLSTGETGYIEIDSGDKVVTTLGCMTDNSMFETNNKDNARELWGVNVELVGM
jgi:myosin-crossreactive antigen